MSKLDPGFPRLPPVPDREAPHARGRIYASVLDVIGATPMGGCRASPQRTG